MKSPKELEEIADKIDSESKKYLESCGCSVNEFNILNRTATIVEFSDKSPIHLKHILEEVAGKREGEARQLSSLEMIAQDPKFVAQFQRDLEQLSDEWHRMHGPLESTPGFGSKR